MVHDYCDWCYLPLTDKDRRASIARVLASGNARACASCVKQGRVRTAPVGWKDDAAEWSLQWDAFARLQPHLLPGEQVLWLGSPDPKVWFTWSDWFYIPPGIIFVGFWVLMGALTVRNHDPGMTVFVILCGLAGLYVPFDRFFYRHYRKTRTAYGITSQRALIAAGADVRTKSPLRGQPIRVRCSRSGQHASVEIGGPSAPIDVIQASAVLGSPRFQYGFRRNKVPFSFYDVEHPDAMLSALERAGATRDSP